MESKSCVSSSLMGIRTIRQWIEVQPTQMHADADWVGLSMIRNALREAGVPTQMRSDVDWVGSSMIINALRDTVEPTQIHSDVDWVGLSMIRNALRGTGEPTQTMIRCGLSRLAMIKNNATGHRRTYLNTRRCWLSRLINFTWVEISAASVGFTARCINNIRFFSIRDFAVTASSGRIRQGILNAAVLVFSET